ncbi:dCTP deaminase domain-containing protein [Methylorubrum extorquens]|uniref:dCTP deaminase domain-containing protein n=1 Tax=Methylorubrum extorquens TaxID=408 RepID=UPI003F5E1020
MPERRYGVLTREEIKDEGLVQIKDEHDPTVAPTCYKSASYDLRVGLEYVSPRQGTPELRGLEFGQGLQIPPFGAVIVASREHVCIPDDVIGKFNLRVAYTLKGLIVQVGTQVEPGYHGPLFGLLQNTTDKLVEIPTKGPQSRLFTIEFHRLSQAAQVEKKSYEGLSDIYTTFSFEGTFNSITTNLKNNNDNLSDALRQIEKQRIGQANFWVSLLFSVILVLVISVLAPMLLNITFRWPLNDPTAKGIIDLVPRQLEAAKAQIDQLKAENERTKADLEDRLKRWEERGTEMQTRTARLEEQIAAVRARLERTREGAPR